MAYIYYEDNRLDDAYKWALKAREGSSKSTDNLLNDIVYAQKKKRKSNSKPINAARARIYKAEDAIKNYVREKYDLDETVYEICIDAKDDDAHSVVFLIFHKDDKTAASPGGGQLFLVEFDMQEMLTVKVIWFQ